MIYDCPRCSGTGSLESSDSTDESWWDCSTCKGTGKLADRRRPDPEADKVRRAGVRHAEDAANAHAAYKLLATSMEEVAIYSLRYCEEKYGHDAQARLNCEAALKQAKVVLDGGPRWD